MSWNFNHVGTREAVAQKVLAESYVPQSLKLAIAEVIRMPIAAGKSNGVRVESSGHCDSYSAYLKLEVQSCGIVLDESVPVAAAVPEVAAALA